MPSPKSVPTHSSSVRQSADRHIAFWALNVTTVALVATALLVAASFTHGFYVFDSSHDLPWRLLGSGIALIGTVVTLLAFLEWRKISFRYQGPPGGKLDRRTIGLLLFMAVVGLLLSIGGITGLTA